VIAVLAGAIVAPWSAAALALVPPGRRGVPPAIAVLAGAMVLLGVLLADALAGGGTEVVAGGFAQGIGIRLAPTPAGLAFALLTDGVLLCALLAEEQPGRGRRETAPATLLLAAGLTGLFLTADVFSFYVFFELSMIAAYALVATGEDQRELGSAFVFAIANLVGSTILLIGVAGLYHLTGTLDMSQAAEALRTADDAAVTLVAATFLTALLIKLGLFPFHGWLPAVYAGARPAVAAMLAGALANIAGYGLVRLGAGLFGEQLELAGPVLIALGAVSALYGGLLALARDALPEVLAYSSVAQAGFIVLALGIGGPAGLSAALVVALANGATKALMFVGAELRGRLRSAALILGAMSIAGVPPSAGFVGKLELVRATGETAAWWALGAVVAASALGFGYAWRIHAHDAWRDRSELPPERASWLPRVATLILLAAVLAAGLWPEPLLRVGTNGGATLPGAP
jgi:multicomponent Na+:H+ antiporter subunit D